jgi:CHAT domain-containing protein
LPFLQKVCQTLEANEFRESRMAAAKPKILDEFVSLCSGDEELAAWCSELERWVRWYRLHAYWLTSFLQRVTLERQSIYHVLACSLFSDAQILFADDTALSSLETAYLAWQRNKEVLGETFERIGAQLKHKLHSCFEYYRRWTRPYGYLGANPCANHLYNKLSASWLIYEAQESDPGFSLNSAEALQRLIDQCNSDDLAFYAILARRFLGLLHDENRNYEAAAGQYTAALGEARRLKLDTEIGHLRRLLGWSLRYCGRIAESRHHLEQALAYERLGPLFGYTGYWQALSARELGDTLLWEAGQATAPGAQPGQTLIRVGEVEKLKPARAAYHDGRMMFSGHLTLQSPFPVARAAKQQLFRSYSANAVQVACFLRSEKDMLAEVELNGPRQITELVTEIRAARNQTSLETFRRNRALYYQTLNTVPATFEDYLTQIEKFSADRRSYLEEFLHFDRKLMTALESDAIAERAIALRLAGTIFILFHVEARESTMVLMDMASGLAAPYRANFGEEKLRAIHAEYDHAIRDPAGREPDAVMQSALDTLLARYEDLLGPLLEPVLPFLPGKHLKVFPRLQMNAVPLHALLVKGKRLIEYCATVSYGQTLGLFLENHAASIRSQPLALRVVLGERVPYYEPLLPNVARIFGSQAVEERPKTWSELKGSIAGGAARDTLFACHGEFNGDRLYDSHLEFVPNSAGGSARFSEIFAELDLRDCRSAIMGACESGLARSGVSAEYLGLPSAMLSSGVKYVVSALWKIPQVATAVLVLRLVDLLKAPATSVCVALSQVQREVMTMTRNELTAWLKAMFATNPGLPIVLAQVEKWDNRPFLHPYYWAGLYVCGDV